MLEIRRYQPEDNEVVKELHYAGLAQFGAAADPYHDKDLDDIESVYINSRGDFLVGIDDGEVVAMGALKQKTDTCGEIKRIRVRRDRQRSGYARKMLSRLVELAEEMGYTELILDATIDNIPAQRLFEKCGFVESHHGRVGVYDLVFYAKKLKEGSD